MNVMVLCIIVTTLAHSYCAFVSTYNAFY